MLGLGVTSGSAVTAGDHQWLAAASTSAINFHYGRHQKL